jgi:arylsulfatase A-like enzyme
MMLHPKHHAATCFVAAFLATALAFGQTSHSVGAHGQATRGVLPPPATPPTPLDVLIIVMDDVGVDQIGCYAKAYPSLPLPCTPNIDCLAARGVRFTNCWASPVCSPSRAQLMTGKYGSSTGIGSITSFADGSRMGLTIDQYTLARLFSEADPSERVAMAFGKWHLADITQGPSHPIELGFSVYKGSLFNLNIPQSVSPSCYDVSYCDWCKTEANAAGTYQGAHHSVYATVDTTDDAIAALDDELPLAHAPWLLYVAYNASHAPFDCPTACGYACQPGCSWCDACNPNSSDAEKARAMTAAMDAEIGRLLQHVDFDRTAIFVLGDNGSAPSTVLPPFDPFKSKVTMYQGGLLVPLIACVPGGPASCAGATEGVCHALVSVNDLFATAADFALLVPPVDAARDSVSLAQFLDPRYALSGAAPRARVYAESFLPHFTPTESGGPPSDYVANLHMRAVRNAQYKLIEISQYRGVAPGDDGTSLEFFELAENPGGGDPASGPDPFELDDLLARPATWTQADADAFLELRQALATEHVLRTGFPATGWTTAALSDGIPSCFDSPLEARASSSFSIDTIERAELEFDASSLAPNVEMLDAELDLAIESAPANGALGIEIHPLILPLESLACVLPGGRFDAFGPSVYAAQSIANASIQRIPLATEAAFDWTAQRCALGIGEPLVLPVGVRLAVEDPNLEDGVAFADPAASLPQLLRVFYARAVLASCP